MPNYFWTLFFINNGGIFNANLRKYYVTDGRSKVCARDITVSDTV